MHNSNALYLFLGLARVRTDLVPRFPRPLLTQHWRLPTYANDRRRLGNVVIMKSS